MGPDPLGDWVRLGWELAGVCGIDPRPLTLRQLLLAADARQRAEWDRAAGVAAALSRALATGEVIDPLKLIPGRYRPGGAADAPRWADQTDDARALLRAGLRDLNRQGGHASGGK